MYTLFLFIATLLATTTMTLFSYLVSASFRDLYKEPVLLQFVLAGLDMKLGKVQERIAAWLIHYFIGFLFVLGYLIPVGLGYYTVSWLSGLVFGALIGIIGILSWRLMFRISGRMPMVAPKVYFIQLFIAHIIFGLTVAATFILLLPYYSVLCYKCY